MAIIIDTPTIHKSLAQLVLSITPNACVYDNPNQQGTHLPAWFIVHREPVDIKEDLHGRWWLNYHIDLFYMLDFNGPHLFDDYSAIADQLGDASEFLPIYGNTGVVVHTYERSWGMYMDALKFSINLKFRVTRDATTPAYMQVIEDFDAFIKPTLRTITVRFINVDYSFLLVELPATMYIQSGQSVTLPTITGEYEDSDGNVYEPVAWSLGAFGETVGPIEHSTFCNLIMHKIEDGE
jgi:hypothetical protein